MNEVRKINWFACGLYFNLCKLLYKRDKCLWVYGCRKGRKYDDNTKYLFEYVNKHHSNVIHSVWLAADEKVVEDVRNGGGEAYTFYSQEGKSIAKRAGVAIFSYALDDFGAWPMVGGAVLVFLGHGVGFKKTFNAKLSGLAKFLKNVMDKLFSWIRRDITIATSEYNRKQRRDIAGLKDLSQIYITGQPRNDVLWMVDRNSVLEKLGIDASKKVILYMPTYRMASMGKDAMERIVTDLYDCEALSRVLDDGNYIFVAKLHPITPVVNIPQRDNFRILGYNEIEANQELLAAGDMLITDYSSCCVDFALLERPVIFYQPDEEKFFKHSETVCSEFFDISSKNSSKTLEELVNLIEKPSLDATNAINDLYEDPSIKGTCYSENVYNLICEKIGM